MSLDLLGCDEIGFDYGALLSAAGTLAQGGIAIYEGHKAEEKSEQHKAQAGDMTAKADLNAASAIARADVSAQLKSASADKDKNAAAAALAIVMKAGETLSPDQTQARLDANKALLASAQKDAAANPKDGYKKAYAGAWEAILKALAGPPAGEKHGESESWFTRRVVGPIPGYGVLVGGAGILGIIGLTIRALVKRK